MIDANQKGMSYTAGFFVLIGITIAGLFLASIISLPVWTLMTGKSWQAMTEGLEDPANSNAVKVIQCIQALIGFLTPALLTAYILSWKPATLIGFKGKITGKQVALVMVIIFSALFVSGLLSYINELIPVSHSMRLKFEKMENDYNRQMQAIIGLNNPGEYILALVVIAFLPALCEETLFRGGLQNYLTRGTKMPWLSIIVVSILFSGAHFSYFGFLSRFFLGIVLGLIYQYSGRIWLCILGHFFNNAVALTVLYVYKLNGKTLDESMEKNSSVSAGLVALPIFIALVYLFYKVSRPQREVAAFSFEVKKDNPSHGI